MSAVRVVAVLCAAGRAGSEAHMADRELLVSIDDTTRFVGACLVSPCRILMRHSKKFMSVS